MKFFGKELKFNGKRIYHENDKPTPSEIGAAASSHGNHVPSTQTANARIFLRNDNTWGELPSATTSATGIVQLNDTVISTSITQAATANAVKKAYDLANEKASKSVATTSADGLMSSADKVKLDSLGSGNTSKTVYIEKSNWAYNSTTKLYHATVSHNLNNDILYIGGHDTDSKENVLLSYKVVSSNELELSLMQPLNLSITLVFKGEIVKEDTTVIDDASTTVTSTWSSSNIQKKIEQIASNTQFNTSIPSNAWEEDGSLVSATLTHNINKKILYIGAYDSTSKESIFISYKIIDDSNIKVSIETALNAVITIVFEGSVVNLAGGDIEDGKVSLTSTWSSAKIQSSLPTISIEDEEISPTSTWSSAKIQSSLPILATTSNDGLMSKTDKIAISTIGDKLDKSSITFSTEDPSGGNHGDIWFKYEE